MSDNEIYDRRSQDGDSSDVQYGRKSAERRGWKFGLIFRTNESFRLIENWLEDNCKFQWGLTLEDMDDSLNARSYKVMFDDEEDKQAFVQQFTGRR
jgi:hypothetical protein